MSTPVVVVVKPAGPIVVQTKAGPQGPPGFGGLAPTGTGFVTVTSGAYDTTALAYPLGVAKGGTGATTFGTAGILHGSGTSAVTCSLVVDADVGASAAIAFTKLTAAGSNTQVQWNNGGIPGGDSGFTYSSGVANLSVCLSLGGTPAVTGALRLTNNTGLYFRNAGNSRDVPTLVYDSSDILNVGDWQANGNTWAILNAKTNVGVLVGDDGASYTWLWQHGSIGWQNGGPIRGYTGQASPYSVHQEVVVAAPSGGTTTLAASEYAMELIQVSTALGAAAAGTGGNIDFPTPSAGLGYRKHVYNGATTSITCRKAGGGGGTVVILSGKSAIIWVKSDGCYRQTPDT
jgi:hypothetical protein